MIRRLLHALGWHWWTPWRDVLTYSWLGKDEAHGIIRSVLGDGADSVTFQRRKCQLCPARERRAYIPAEQRRVVEV